MEKMHYVLYLNPPRPTFIMDMSDEERTIMGRHVEYWNKFMEKGKIIAFGPVLDPAGVYGVGIAEVESEEELKDFIKNDPANGVNSYEYYPMKAIIKK
jgi:uncharacterized protein YciI